MDLEAKCCVCGNTQLLDKMASFHCFPDDKTGRAIWLDVFDIRDEAAQGYAQDTFQEAIQRRSQA